MSNYKSGIIWVFPVEGTAGAEREPWVYHCHGEGSCWGCILWKGGVLLGGFSVEETAGAELCHLNQCQCPRDSPSIRRIANDFELGCDFFTDKVPQKKDSNQKKNNSIFTVVTKSGVNVFVCTVCSKNLSDKSGVTRHHDYYEKKGKSCNGMSQTTQANSTTVQTSSVVSLFPCDQCDKICSDNSSRIKHIQAKHQNNTNVLSDSAKLVTSKSNKVQCPYCDKELASKGHLKDHIKAKHPENSSDLELSAMTSQLSNINNSSAAPTVATEGTSFPHWLSSSATAPAASTTQSIMFFNL